MSAQSIDDVKQEIDALVRRCGRLRNDDERRRHIALCERQLLNADWDPREAKYVTKGTLWILDLGRA
jgi:hypothetical protein